MVRILKALVAARKVVALNLRLTVLQHLVLVLRPAARTADKLIFTPVVVSVTQYIV